MPDRDALPVADETPPAPLADADYRRTRTRTCNTAIGAILGALSHAATELDLPPAEVERLLGWRRGKIARLMGRPESVRLDDLSGIAFACGVEMVPIIQRRPEGAACEAEGPPDA